METIMKAWDRDTKTRLATLLDRAKEELNKIDMAACFLVDRNSGTFMLKPLQQIFGDKLENSSGIRNSQVVLLNDFQYQYRNHPGVRLNHFAEDITLASSNDIPIVASSSAKIEFSRFSPNYQSETKMMDCWQYENIRNKRLLKVSLQHFRPLTNLSQCHCLN